MFCGVRSHHDAKSVHSYDTARAALERAMKTPTGKCRTAKQYGFHLGMSRNHGVTWVREEDDGTIAFRLYDTDVVIWHPDNSFEVDNFGTVTTSGFASTFLPGGVSLAYPVERRGSCGGHRGIYYRVGRTPGERWSGTRMVCFGGLPRFREVDGDWRPDADTIDTIKFPELDSKRARAIGRKYPLADLEKWLVMAPHHMDLEHEGWDLDECVHALENRNFTNAAQFLPPITIPNGWGASERIKPLPIRCAGDKVITPGSVKKLRLALYQHEGLFSTVELTEMTCDEFDRYTARVRQLRELDVIGHCDYGPYA